MIKIINLIDKWIMNELYSIYPDLTAHMKKNEKGKINR